MKKCFKKLTLIASAILFASTSSAQNSDGTRVDYLNEAGMTLESSYVKSGFEVFRTFGLQEGVSVSSSRLDGISSMKFVPWGQESYPLSVNVAEGESDLKVYYEVIKDSKSPVRKAEGQVENVKCGDLIRIHIETQGNAFPALRVRYMMTGYYPEQDMYADDEYSADGLRILEEHTLYDDAFFWLNPATRESFTYLSDTGNFVRDSGNPGHWTFDIPMQNEPVQIEVFTQHHDFEQLRTISIAALRSLYKQYLSMGVGPQCSGEPWFMGMGSDYMGQDMISGICGIGLDYVPSMSFLTKADNLCVYVYGLAYAYIARANIVLSVIDEFKDISEAEREWARAQMLALRSHGYWRLLQNFGNRWQDSNNGNAYCAPLELTYSTENKPLATMKEIRDCCYADLDKAISILSSSKGQRSDALEIDANTAKGIKMRIALLCEDWNIVETLAEEIMQTAPMTTNEGLKAGFFRPESSWIWSASNYGVVNGEKQNLLGYWSYQNHDACNGSYPALWGHGANAIDLDLYQSMSETDVRRSLFAMPEQLNFYPFNSLDSWYNPKYVTGGSNLLACRNESWMDASRLFYEYYDQFKPEGVDYPAFYSQQGGAIPVQFGAQVKFYLPGEVFDEASVVLMRTEEIALSRAEAAYHLGDFGTAVDILKQINGTRDANYSFSGTGKDIMDEIIRTRRLELWGEGHSWYDRKRWNLPIDRTIYDADSKEGNWPDYVPSHIDTNYANGWRYVLPNAAVRYNPAIDVTLMKYTDDPNRKNPTSAPVAVAPAPGKAKKQMLLQPSVNKELQTKPVYNITK